MRFLKNLLTQLTTAYRLNPIRANGLVLGAITAIAVDAGVQLSSSAQQTLATAVAFLVPWVFAEVGRALATPTLALGRQLAALALVPVVGTEGVPRFYLRPGTGNDAAFKAKDAWYLKCALIEEFDGAIAGWTTTYPQGMAYVKASTAEKAGFPAAWNDFILKDQAGNPVTQSWGGGVQWAMDVTNQGWRAVVVQQCVQAITDGFRGIWGDDWNFTLDVFESTVYKNGSPLTVDQLSEGFAFLAEELRAALPSTTHGQRALIQVNCPWFEPFASSSQPGTIQNPYFARMLKQIDLVDREGGLAADTGIGGTGGDVRFELTTMLSWIDGLHSYGVGVVVDGFPSDDAGRELDLALYYLVGNGLDYIGDASQSPTSSWAPFFSTGIGAAAGPRQLISGSQGAWTRKFAGGIVVLNGPGEPTRTVQLGGSYKNTAGQTVTAVTVGPRQGAVLTAIAVPVPPPPAPVPVTSTDLNLLVRLNVGTLGTTVKVTQPAVSQLTDNQVKAGQAAPK